MRLFAALEPPTGTLDAVGRALADARPDRRGARRDVRGVRWTPRADWHLTLVFLGEVPDERVPALRERFTAETAGHPAMTLALRGAGTFPDDAARARVLWAGVEGDVAALTRLAEGLRDAAADLGVPVEHRPYVPHLTLVRTRWPSDLSALRRSLDGIDAPPWRAADVHLVHSRPNGAPRYRTVATCALS
ncbi:2'-5' RNA ligase [Spinactinospora alkalitolerans]|uniref:RNA 2',3'-cyclic phosphodiesterase n=1 Tax=Spinactinospora alkalitolerans TaxID=687207 RepID=A0A852TLS4_9ACTN|nr:RNA 2',3'-cyclic phosphodiesterase [Spinactinospora alkalitolerans]NYE45186.1 2'-5' RNA ligase [Spinactinospora alkalitolerans]